MPALGCPRAHFRLTDSTNERAKALAREGAPHGTLVTAAEQTAGRGRQGRSWTAPPGKSLLMSVLLRGLEERHALLPLAAAVAVCDALRELDCRIKWPNDIWIERRKLAGILVEGRPQEGWAVLGLGLNVAVDREELPAELRDAATSLRLAGVELSVEEVLERLLDALTRRLEEEPDGVLEAWRERDALRGDRIRWESGEGVASGIADDGALLVETADGLERLDAGEVHLALG